MTGENEYRAMRKKAGFTSAAAAAEKTGINPDRLSRLERGEIEPNADDVKRMADAYRAPKLARAYCHNQCPIGRGRMPYSEEDKGFMQITLELLTVLNHVNTEKERLIQIAADGKVNEDEVADFRRIKVTLDEMAETIAQLQQWAEDVTQGAGF